MLPSSGDCFTVHGGAPGAVGPVVILFGFVGSSPRQVAKYASAFLTASKTADSVENSSIRMVYSTTAPTSDVFIFHSRMRKLAAKALTLLEEKHPETPAILAYLSNGGAFVHMYVQDLLAKDGAAPESLRRFGRVRLVGTVFDSAPAYISQVAMARAGSDGFRGASVRFVSYWFLRFLLPWVLPLVHGARFVDDFWNACVEDPTPCRSLYIYSAHDEVTDYARLDALVAQRRTTHRLGADGIRTLRISSDETASPHVQHLLRHTERYRSALSDFLRDVS